MPLTPSSLGLPASRFPSYYDGQLVAALAVGRSPYRFSLLHAPTGCGKSLIAMTIARLLGASRTLYLTATKGLQDQVLESFEESGMVDIRGQSNYPCRAVMPGGDLAAFGRAGDTCDIGPCKVGITCGLRAGGCDYYDLRDYARNASFVDGNYAYWMATNRYGDAGGEREPPLGAFDLIIMDEAHRAADLLSSFCAVELDDQEVYNLTSRCTLPGSGESGLSIRQWSEWAAEVLPFARAGLADLRAELGKGARSRELIDAERLCQSISTIARAADHADTTWITERVKAQRPSREVAKFTPMWAHRWAEPYLYAGCPRIVMMSANLDEDDARYLGVPDGQYDYHEMDSTFPASRRPVIYVPFAPRVPVDRKMTDWMVAKWLDRHNRIVGDRLDRKGIIQPGSYERAARIVDALRRHGHNGLQVFTHHDGRGTAAAVDYYLRAKAPAVLVSPSVQEGYDFIGDKARYNIISKVPFIDSRDAVNAARAATDKGYGNHVAARSILQRAGRTTRTRVDWSECHLTDSHWEWFRRAGRFPRYFRAAFRQCDVLPEPLAFDDIAA